MCVPIYECDVERLGRLSFFTYMYISTHLLCNGELCTYM